MVEPVTTHESQNQVDTASPSSPSEEQDRATTESSGTLSKSQDPPSTNTAVVANSRHAKLLAGAVPIALPPTAVIPSHQRSSKIILKANPAYINENAKHLAPVPTPTVLCHRSDNGEAVLTLASSTRFSTPALIQDGLRTLVEPLAVHRSRDIVDPPLLSSIFGERTHVEPRSTENPSTPQAPSSTKTAATPPSSRSVNVPAAAPLCVDSIPVITPHPESSEVGFQDDSVDVPEKTTPSTSASNDYPTASGVTLATPLDRGMCQVSSLRTSRVDLASLSALLDDSQPEIVKNDGFSPAPTPNNRVPTPTAAEVYGIATQYRSLGRESCDLGAALVSYKGSTKIANEGLDIIDPAGWSGKSLDEIAADLRRRTSTTVPQSMERATLTSTPSSGDEKSCELHASTSLLFPLSSTTVNRRLSGTAIFLPAPTPNNRAPTPTAAEVHGIATRDHSLSRGRCDFDTGSVPYKTSRKTAREGLDIIDPAGWSGKSLDEIAAALRRPAATTVSQSTERATSTPTLASSVGKTSFFSGPPVLDQPTPSTSGELRQDHPLETGAPNSSSSSDFEPPNDTPALEAETVVRKLPDDGGEEIVRDPVAGPVPLSANIEPHDMQNWGLPPPSSPDAAPEKIKGASRTKKFIKKMVKRVKGTFKPKNRSQ
ncbi:hypothetical protein FRC01_006817 [Tulasnella sp. 417]|nr:hypothetical protein FRC01_006817 [Tulasnella sp. 417]